MADIKLVAVCSFCHAKDIQWNRIECLICPNYQLCRKCFDNQRYDGPHRLYHPTQPVLTREAFFKHTNSTALLKDDIPLCCPLCGQWKTSVAEFMGHCLFRHLDDPDRVKCPICVTFCVPRNTANFENLNLHIDFQHQKRLHYFICDTCDECLIMGNRYICLVCNQYGLCEGCFKAKRYDKNHFPYHPIQKVPVEVGNDNIYRCPYCGESDFSAGDLADHCYELHFDSLKMRVVCPICVVCRLQFAETLSLKDSFLEHLENYHGLLPKAGDQFELEAEPVECSICLYEIRPAAAEKYFQCFHNDFHDQCINDWLATNPTCPVCRAKRIE